MKSFYEIPHVIPLILIVILIPITNPNPKSNHNPNHIKNGMDFYKLTYENCFYYRPNSTYKGNPVHCVDQ